MTEIQQSFLDELAKFKDELYWFIFYATRQKDDADEVFQETILLAYKNWHQLREINAVRAWLFQIARNVIKVYYAKLSKNALLYEAEKLDAFLDHSAPDMTTNLTLAELINEMPKLGQTIFILHTQHGYKLKEIAELLHIKTRKVKYQYAKMKEIAQKYYADGEIGYHEQKK